MANDSTPIHDTYPVVVSKLDPLVIRVSDLVLLVGSTSYTAKVKMGQMFNGYHIYVSSVGTPIYKQVVDISGRSTDSDNNRSEGSDAWRYIAACARTWMDDLEKSMTEENTQKNIVDLLREIKFQEHFDMTGYTTNSELYPNLELDVRQPVYMKSVIEKINDIYEAIYGADGLNSRVTQINNTLSTMDGHIDEIEGKLQTIGANVHDLDTHTQSSISTVHDDLNNIKSQLDTMNVTTLPGVADKISMAITSGLESLVGQMSAMNTNITSVDDYVRSDTYGLPMLKSRTNSIQVGGMLYANVKDTLDEVKSNDHGLEAIMGAASGGSGTSGRIYEAVTALQNTVNGMSSTVNETAQYVYGEPYGAGTSTGLYDFIYRRENSIYAILCNPDSRFVDWVDEESRYVAHTHADI